MRAFALSLALSVAASASAALTPSVVESRLDRLVSSRSLAKRAESKDNYNITIFHINDVHAHLDEFAASGTDCTNPARGCYGGYARTKDMITKLRPEHNNTLFLDVGDEFQGTLFFTYYGGEKIGDTINQLGFDAFVPGNHEWDRGDDYLAEFLANLTFPTLCANVVTNNTALNKTLVPYHIFEEHNLAVVAVTTDTIPSISNPGPGTSFLDPTEVVQATVDKIYATTNVTRVIAMTHIGYEVDKKMAQNTRGVHLIVGAHSHTLLGDMEGAEGKYPTIETNLDGDEVFIVTSYRWGEYLGMIDVVFDSDGKIVEYSGAPIHLDNTTSQDTELQATIEEWRGPFEEYASQVLAETVGVLDHSKCKSEECTLGDLAADATLAYRLNISEGASACILNGGGVRATIDAGNITVGQVLTSFPFGNAVTEVTFTGADLWKIFEGVASQVNQWNNEVVSSIAQVSKEIRYSYNPDNAVGSRLISLSIKNQSISSDTTDKFTIVTWDFVASGGDNIFPEQSGFTTLATQDEAFMQYLRSVKSVNVSLDGRVSTTDQTTPSLSSQGGDGDAALSLAVSSFVALTGIVLGFYML
ncbi:Metallo-dependent phosphatase [Cylindrobasidium torrendii FP15055 ss-10]|uniref:Metallo-dependent phosphatase n=1 Tax=Cylindrobasidium torrendii FP15055 ss-10 TaxID=1314674 RepID=A0A0D7BLH5_9AGAR|nr:Metallo-dependent phosphatase [Cylindrobasidium torrendii FP15055 ss-10]